jgi:hypothetical protein
MEQKYKYIFHKAKNTAYYFCRKNNIAQLNSAKRFY